MPFKSRALHLFREMFPSCFLSRKLDDGAYEVLRTFLKKHHDNDWKVAVKKTLKVVPRGEKSAYVCKANKSHETKWMELEHSRVDN